MSHATEMRPGAVTLRILSAVIVATVAGADAARAATEVNTCGQVLKGSGYLAADLDCTGFPGDAVTIDGGSLDLRGYTLTADGDFPVLCTKGCRVFSEPVGGSVVGEPFLISVNADAPGTDRAALRVSGAVIIGGVMSEDGPVKIQDCTITNAIGVSSGIGRPLKITGSMIDTTSQIAVSGGNTKIFDSTILNAGGQGVNGDRVLIRGTTISGTAAGQEAVKAFGPVKIENSNISNNGGPGIHAQGESIKAIDSTISNNAGRGIDVACCDGNVFVSNSTIDGNTLEGIFADSQLVRVEASTISNNGLDGIRAGGMEPTCFATKVTSSSVVGNGTDPNCGISQTCADIASCDAPVVTGGSCGTSYDINSGFPGASWGVCSLD